MKREKLHNKLNGRVYTDNYIVNIILDFSGYIGGAIRKRHIIDNSCGDGAFLVEVLDRYCRQCINENLSVSDIIAELQSFIHGIEIDERECIKCRNNLSKVLSKYNLPNIEFDICCADALGIEKYNGKMDYVVGNPPYIRVHNLGDSFDSVKKFEFTRTGMTDLYIAFFELGIKMLSKCGTLGYITPSSYFNSLAGGKMRQFLARGGYLDKILDFKHFRVFNCAATYAAITILKNGKKTGNTDYFEFDENTNIPKLISNLRVDEYYISGNFYFSSHDNLKLLKEILLNYGICDIQVKNGYATLNDDVFINNFDFDSKYIKPIIKASRGCYKKMIYPYDNNACLVDEDELKKDEKLYSYLNENKDRLKKRDMENISDGGWYAFGRSQGLNDTNKKKFSINNLIRNKNDLKILDAPAGVGVYSGLYILSENLTIDEIKNTLISDEFETYVALLGKYKSGGYYAFSSRDVKVFLNYKFSFDGGLKL